jgi:hypothetical protein
MVIDGAGTGRGGSSGVNSLVLQNQNLIMISVSKLTHRASQSRPQPSQVGHI